MKKTIKINNQYQQYTLKALSFYQNNFMKRKILVISLLLFVFDANLFAQKKSGSQEKKDSTKVETKTTETKTTETKTTESKTPAKTDSTTSQTKTTDKKDTTMTNNETAGKEESSKSSDGNFVDMQTSMGNIKIKLLE